MGSIADISEVLLELGLSSSSTEEERAVVSQAIARAEASVNHHLRYDPVQRMRTEYYPQQVLSYQPREGVWEADANQAYLRDLSEASTSELQLKHIPIRSIASLHIDYDGRGGAQVGSFAAETLKVEGTDYWPNYDGVDSGGSKLCKDGILRSIGRWPQTPGTVKVVYMAGYTAAELRGQDLVVNAGQIVEAVVVEACRRVRRMFAMKKRTGAGFAPGIVTSESLGDYSYSIDASSASRLTSGSSDLSAEAVDLLSGFVNWGWEL
jgi:hypothetical protein